MKKSLLALLLSMALALTACGGPVEPESPLPDPGGSADQSATAQPATLSLAAYPAYSFHPALSGNKVNLTLAPLLYEGLFQLDETFTPQPVLCRSYSVSDDGLTWSFQLRAGVTFSDGTPLTGENVAAALNTALGSGSRYQQRLSNVRRVTAGEGSVSLTLAVPNGGLPALLDVPIALSDDPRAPGTGPYVLTEGEDGLGLAARQGWWQDKQLPLSEISLREIAQTDGLIAAFDAGDVTAQDADLTGTNALGYSGSSEVWDYSTSRLLYLGFNTQRGLCRDAAVRRAVAQAVDRIGIVSQTFAGHAKASALPVHPDSALYDSALAAQLEYDPEGMAAGLEEARALGKTLVLLVNSENTARVSAAEHLAYQLEAAGMKVTVTSLSFDDYQAALKSGSFDLYLAETLLGADFDLTALAGSGGGLNYGGWRDSQTDALLYALRAARGEDERKTASAALLTYLNEQVPFTAVCFKNGSVLTQWGRLTGLSPVQNNVFYQLENWSIQ